MGLICQVCSFYPHFSVGQVNNLGSHPLMCMLCPAMFFFVFAGMGINIILCIFMPKRYHARGHDPPANTFVRDRLRFQPHTLNNVRPVLSLFFLRAIARQAWSFVTPTYKVLPQLDVLIRENGSNQAFATSKAHKVFWQLSWLVLYLECKMQSLMSLSRVTLARQNDKSYSLLYS